MDESIDRALQYIAATQLPDGNFLSYSSPSLHPFQEKRSYHTVFTPALILSCLSRLQVGAEIRERIATYLRLQKSDHWSFNYWDRQSSEAKQLPYPDDLDDTFCALSALWQYDPKLIGGSELAHIVQVLIACESRPGGPYKTWLIGRQSSLEWQDVDIAVNANVAYFLRLAVQPIPQLTAYLTKQIQASAYASPYYPDAYAALYYLGRAYQGASKDELVSYLWGLQSPDGSWGSPLHTAMAMSTLLRLDTPKMLLHAAADCLQRQQQVDGSWKAEPFCIDPARGGHTWYGGSGALTTAFALEALALWSDTPKSQAKPKETPRAIKALQESIEAQAKSEYSELAPDIRQLTLGVFERIQQSNNRREILLLPYVFSQGLREKPVISQEFFVHLGLASLHGWMAYTIFDDFLDDEGSPRLLPVATMALRASIQQFQQALNVDTFNNRVQTIFDTMDAANTWEQLHCRFVVENGIISIGQLPNYGRLEMLANRSAGHVLAPLAVLLAGGVSPSGVGFRAIERALRHYIIAKQLSDDMHDYKEDLLEGRITYVVASCLRALKISKGGQSMTDLVPRVERMFWHEVLFTICDKTAWHTTKARQEIQRSGLFEAHNVLIELLEDIDKIIRDTRDSVQVVQDFLKTYR